MLCLICKYYLNITFLPRSNINRLLNFTDVYICFWFSVKKVLLILGLTKCNTKFVFFCFILTFFSFCTLLIKRKKEWFKKKKDLFYTFFCSFAIVPSKKCFSLLKVDLNDHFNYYFLVFTTFTSTFFIEFYIDSPSIALFLN